MNSTKVSNVVLNRVRENVWNPVPNNNDMAFAGERIVTEGNSGLWCAKDRTDGESDGDDRCGVTRNVTLE